MYIYNVTVKIENDVAKSWLHWMLEKHIPDVMATGYFLEYKMVKVLVDDTDGETYSIQYFVANMEDYEEYRALKAPLLQKDLADTFPNKYVAFRTMLQVIK